MTTQEMFNIVALHLLNQAEKSFNDVPLHTGDEGNKSTTVSCAYRGLGGRKCAIGALIPDHVYEESMEGGTINFLLMHYPNLERYIPDQKLADELQILHDSQAVEEWAEWLAILANRYSLTMPDVYTTQQEVVPAP